MKVRFYGNISRKTRKFKKVKTDDSEEKPHDCCYCGLPYIKEKDYFPWFDLPFPARSLIIKHCDPMTRVEIAELSEEDEKIVRMYWKQAVECIAVTEVMIHKKVSDIPGIGISFGKKRGMGLYRCDRKQYDEKVEDMNLVKFDPNLIEDAIKVMKFWLSCCGEFGMNNKTNKSLEFSYHTQNKKTTDLLFSMIMKIDPPVLIVYGDFQITEEQFLGLCSRYVFFSKSLFVTASTEIILNFIKLWQTGSYQKLTTMRFFVYQNVGFDVLRELKTMSDGKSIKMVRESNFEVVSDVEENVEMVVKLVHTPFPDQACFVFSRVLRSGSETETSGL